MGYSSNGIRKLLLSFECSRSQENCDCCHTDYTKEVLVTKINRKKNAARMLEQAIQLSSRIANSGMSDKATGRLEKEMHKYLAVLKRLEQDDPGDTEFWEILQKAILKIVRCLRQISR